MTQQTFNNLDSLLTARTVINDNADDAESRLSAFEVDQQQIVYVAKAGSDSNDGLSFGAAKLTIGSAITAASGMTPTTSNQVTIQVLDAGEYQEDLVLPEWVHIFAPNAGIDGQLEVSNNTVVSVRRLENTTAATQCVRKTDSGGLSKVTATIMAVTTNQEGVRCFGGQIGLSIGTMTIDGAEGLVAQNGSRILFDIQFVSMVNSSDFIKTNLAGVTSNSIYGEVLRVEDDNTSRLLIANAVGDDIDIQAGSVAVLDLYELGTDTILNLYVNTATGTKTDGTNTTINIMDLAGDSSLGGDLNFATGKGVFFDGVDYTPILGSLVVTAAPAISGTITLEALRDTLSYHKFGPVVTVTGMIQVLSVSSPVGSYIRVSLPFAVANFSEFSSRFSGSLSYFDGATIEAMSVRGVESETTTRIDMDASTISAGDQFTFSLTYFTEA